MRISRPCYDKYHRCPGWVGGGFVSARVIHCNNGRIQINYDDPWWTWKFQRCDTCDVVVFPFHANVLDPTYWWYMRWSGVRMLWDDLSVWRVRRFKRRHGRWPGPGDLRGPL